MADKDYLLEDSDFPSGQGDPNHIADLKKASYRQLKDVMVIADYVFCSLLQSSRLASLDPQTLREKYQKPLAHDEATQSIKQSVLTEPPRQLSDEQAMVKVEQVIFHQGHLITTQFIENADSELPKTLINTYGLSSSTETFEKSSVDLNHEYFLPN